LDALALDVADLEASAGFYRTVLSMDCVLSGTTCIASFAGGSILLQAGKPALSPHRAEAAPGSGDFCLIAEGRMADIHAALAAKDAPFEPDMGVVPRTGATGPMESVYLRDPDGNLVEIGVYGAGAVQA
jgi:catechol 2,3-dioxygenase-like lactoylglutathione lyase family enzyme